MPEINDDIQSRLQDNQEEVFPNNLDTMSAKEVGETLTNIVGDNLPGTEEKVKQAGKELIDAIYPSKGPKGIGADIQKVPQPVTKTRATRVPKVVAAKIDASVAIQKLREQATKTQLLIGLIEWCDECVSVQDMPADLEKGPRDLLIAYTKEIESVKAKYIQQIQAL